MKVLKLISATGLALGFAFACGGMSTQAGGSNTNWFETCASSAECGSGLECWCGICTTACATECTSAAAAATCSEPPANCTDPSKKSACAVPCAKDADCHGVAANATCIDGVCGKSTKTTTTSDGGRTATNDSGGKLSCAALGASAQNQIAALIDKAPNSCTSDADCANAPAVSCQGGCGNGALSKAGAASIASGLDAIEQSVCAPFSASGCPNIPLPCAFPGTPTCVAGTCKDVLPGQPTPDSGTASCDALGTTLNDQLFPMVDSLDKSCKVDDDCTREQTGLTCDNGCPVPVSRTAAASFDAKRAALESSLCPPYLAQGCMPLFFGCPLVPGDAPHCVKGTCTDVLTVTGTPDSGQSCSERTTALDAELQPVVDAADRTCAVDGDCKVVMLVNQCVESCTYSPASVSGAASIQNELDKLDANECPDFKSAGCTVQRLPCVAPPTPKCSAGKCSVP